MICGRSRQEPRKLRKGNLMTRRAISASWAVIFVACILLPKGGLPAPAPASKVVIAAGMEPVNLEPCLVGAGGDYPVVENYGEYLIQKAPSGDLGPGLATSWKISPDGKTIEFTLRKDVRFHSGDLLTARDVLFSYERGRAKNPVLRTQLQSVEKFEVKDDDHFKVYFKTPDVTFIPNRACVMIVSKGYYDRVGEDAFVRSPVGTGPYRFVRYLAGQYVDLERFEDYWGKKPPVKEARFLFVPEDTTRIAKLRAGEVDFINSVPYPSVKELEGSPNFKVVRLALGHPTRGVVIQTLNPKAPWHDRRVRQAMAYAIDWKSIVNNLLQGVPNHYVFLAPHELGYDPSLKPYPYDPKKAKELLAEAGYPKGFDLNLYWPVSGRVPMSNEICEAIASYFEAIGIRTKLVGEETAAFYARRRSAKNPNVDYVCYFSGGLAGAPDPTYYLQLYFGTDGAFSVYSNPELDRIIAEARTTMSSAKRAELIKKAVRILYDEVAFIPIINNVSVYAMKKNIEFVPTQKHGMDLVLVKDIAVK